MVLNNIKFLSKHICWFACLNLLLLTTCTKSIKTKEELIGYINEPQKGLRKTEQIGDIKAVLLFKPWQLIRQNGKKGTDQFDKDLSDKYFFVLSLSANDKEVLRQLDFNKYSEMVQVLAFRMSEYITLVPDEGKPTSPEECFFQQTYGVSRANQVLIVFDKKYFTQAKQIKIKIHEFGLNIGNLVFDFDVNDIKKIPPIII